MPPHAFSKSPDSISFNSGVQGEWSDVIKLIIPSFSPRQSLSLLSAFQIGGAHLNRVSPSDICSDAKWR